MENNNKELTEAVNTLAKEIAKSLKFAQSEFDRTFISVVKSVNTDGTYSVLDDYGVERKCVFAIPNATLSLGQRVYVTIPSGNLNNIYISGVHPQINPH